MNSPSLITHGQWPGIEFRVWSEDISRLTTWAITSPRHTAVVHLAGRISRLETELEGTGRLGHAPMPGEVWVIPAEARYASLAQGQPVRYAELFFDPALPAELAGRGLTPPPVRPRAGHYDEFLYRGVQRLAAFTARPDDLAELAGESLARTLYLHFLAGYQHEPPRVQTRLRPEQKRRLEEFVRENLGGRIRLADLAHATGLSGHALLPAFREAFGFTPAQYVIEERLRQARALLRHTKWEIAEIALRTGFANHAHLTASFRTRVGVTPQEFRKAE